MQWSRHIGSTLLVLLVSAAVAEAQSSDANSVVMQPRVLSPREYLTGDTTRRADDLNIPGATSGGYSALQDSAYKRALAIDVPARARFMHTTRILSSTLSTARALEPEPTLWDNINRNLAIPREMLTPSPQQVAQYQVNIANSQYVPGVLMFPMGQGNLQISMGDIAKLFGLTEDVSPRIQYVVDETTEVTITIYNASALKVATIFNGVQPPGVYEIVWNGKDEGNRPVAPGDYVGQVRLGNQRIMNKRIVWTAR